MRAAILVVLSVTPAAAQVSVNPGALSALKPTSPASPASKPSAHRPSARRSDHTTTEHARAHHPTRHEPRAKPEEPIGHGVARPEPHPAAKPAPRLAPRSNVVTLAPAPPPAPTVPPLPPPPAKPAAPPLPVSVLPGAAGAAVPLPTGVRITFGAGKSDLNPATMSALQALARSLQSRPDADLNLFAYAEGAVDDPSTPRRLSLSRALAVRAVLINAGIASTRIYPRAMGAAVPDGPPDRVDVTTGATPAGAPPGAAVGAKSP